MESEVLENVYQQAKELKNTQNYVGGVELYLLRYRTRTNKETRKNEVFPSFYSPLTEPDVQEALLDNFINSEATYEGSDLSNYTVNGGETDSVSYLEKGAYSNIEKLVDLLVAKKDFQTDLRRLNINSLKCYIVRIALPQNGYIYSFGGIKNYSQLQRKGIIVHKSINNSTLKKFDFHDTIGFNLGVSLILYNDTLYVANVKSFETFFRMSEYYKAESENVIKDVIPNNKIQKDTLDGLRTATHRDSKIAKLVSKLKFRAERVHKLFVALNEKVFKVVMSNNMFKDSYKHVMFDNDLLKVEDPTDSEQIRELIKFIADTAQKSMITDESSVGKF